MTGRALIRPWGLYFERLLLEKQISQNKDQGTAIQMVSKKWIEAQTTGLQLGRALPDI